MHSVDTVKARSLWREPAGGGEGRMSVCEFMGMKDHDAKMMLGLDPTSLSAKTDSYSVWWSIYSKLKHIAMQTKSTGCVTASQCLSIQTLKSLNWLQSIQSQHFYVFTLSLGIVLFSLLLCKCWPCRLWKIHLTVKGWKRKTDFPPPFSPPHTLPPRPFYPKYLTSYAVMPQLPNNPQLIKYAAFINNFYELGGNVLSLESWGRCFYTPLFPVCQCAVKCSEWSMHLALRHALDYTFFSRTFCKGGVFPVDFNEEEDKWGYLVIINM